MVLKSLPTEILIRVSMKKENFMGKESMYGHQDQTIKDHSTKEKNMERENGSQKLENFMLESTLKIKSMVSGDTNGKMDASMKVNLAMIRSKSFFI